MTVETIRGVWIKRDKEVTPISYPRDDSDDTSLRVLQECVAGLIEPVRLAYGGTMYVNDSYRFHFGPDDFKRALGAWATGVTIVTTRAGERRISLGSADVPT